MNNIMKKTILKRLKQISVEDLLTYSKEYGITINKTQAEKITSYMSTTKLDPFEEKDRLTLYKKLAQLTDLQTAQKAQQLFNKLIKQYGVESWFN
ncbi:DUF2624 domain-containing protein [Aquibacillus koreensis]|uniref:DUF2624 domain-containing protein n=1 Tax=Aquibacillus koreensis TaxID=279446 RepID=A0A9X3WKZ4_9BACI|nr:DUF2624 domain-containing protein [Aquibacillus koreensis]MCT2537580.1 DUF2624 domain-containing protein [Aquibacillus koreensis]MDC3419026.1 DUF2624 domain-containing protein [Aquibacillus koreensis]